MLNDGYTIKYKIVEKETFKVIGLKDSFKYETANKIDTNMVNKKVCNL